MNQLIQIRVNSTERNVFFKGAELHNLDVTSLVKRSVLYFLKTVKPTPAIQDEFEAALDAIAKAPKVRASASDRALHRKVKKAVEAGRAKGVGKDEALRILREELGR